MKLYIVHVGFYDNEIGIYELHSNMLVVAKSPLEAKTKIQNKSIFKDKQMHIDGICEVNNVDGYEVVLIDGMHNKVDENKTFGYKFIKELE